MPRTREPRHILDEVSDREILEVGAARKARWSWRLRLGLLALVLVVTSAALLVDRDLRRDETRGLERCEAAVAAGVDMAGRRVRAAYEYVRPALTNPTPEMQETARRLVAAAATGADDRLAAPRRACRGVTVLWLHTGLRARRDRCLAVLEAQRAGLVAVADDGGNLSEWSRLPRTCD